MDHRRKYDWKEIQKFYDEGNTLRSCMKKFGCAFAAFSKAAARGEFVTRKNLAAPLALVLVKKSKYSRGHLKKRLIKDGILENVCAICGCGPTWRGNPLVLVIDHINGVRDDARIENLRLLCPNCNSQTPTFSGRNVKR